MSQADKILIGFYLNARELGIYAVAAALVAFVPIVLQSVNQIFSPTIADLHARGQTRTAGPHLPDSYQMDSRAHACRWLAVMIIFAPALMRIFGHDFEMGWPILVIGTLGQLINCGVGSVGYLLLMSGHQRRLIRIQAVMACVMVALSLILIPRWGITGAAIRGRGDQCCYQRLVSGGSAAHAWFVSLQPQLLCGCCFQSAETWRYCCC